MSWKFNTQNYAMEQLSKFSKKPLYQSSFVIIPIYSNILCIFKFEMTPAKNQIVEFSNFTCKKENDITNHR